MTSPLLLHLTTSAEWRAALAVGAVRPPSLTEVGFVHLSTPEQVHLPAERLFAGRRDVLTLVVDPARLTAPVRHEPGVPGDPASMRFPHLYGPLPTAAVLAVVPWRAAAPLDLPGPDDLAGRARALAFSVPVRRAAETLDLPGGMAVLDPAAADSRPDDRLLLTGAVDADSVAAQADTVSAAAGRPVRTATLLHAGARPVAVELARRGWAVSPTLVLARRGPFPAADDARVEVPSGPGRDQRTDRVVQVTDLAVRANAGAGHAVVASLQLWVDGATAAVHADPGAWRHEHSDALLAAALGRAQQAGCDLVVLATAEQAGSRHWLTRRGFEAVATTFDVVAG